jgi:hypothetical protein
MHGVPSDLPLQSFVGSECSFIGLGQWQIQFHFIGTHGTDTGSISVEGNWEFRDASGDIIDRCQEPAEREAYRVHKIIGIPVTHFVIDAPKSFAIYFECGLSLTVYDDSEQYESFSVHIAESKQSFYV